MTNRKIGVWKHIDQDILSRQIDQVEKAERQAREEAEQEKKFEVRSINPTEDALAYRLDRASQFENADYRQAEAVKKFAKFRKDQDKFVNKWEEENRKTIAGIREMEDKYLSDDERKAAKIKEQMTNLEIQMSQPFGN